MRKRNYVPGQAVAVQRMRNRLASPLTSPERDNLVLHAYASLAAFSTGQAHKTEWLALVAMSNLTFEVDALSYQGRYAEIAQAGEEALQSCGERAVKHNRFGFSGPELVSVRALIDLHQQQLEQISRAHYQTALERVEAKWKKKDFHAIEPTNNVQPS